MVFNAPAELTAVLKGGLVVWNIVLSVWMWRIWRHYNQLTRGAKGESLAQILQMILFEIQSINRSLSKLRTETDHLRERSHKFIQEIKLKRYNPFKEVGGDQSFILALLDEDKSGVVVSSLHSRDSTRWFAKKIIDGKGQKHKLSEEEQKVVND